MTCHRNPPLLNKFDGRNRVALTQLVGLHHLTRREQIDRKQWKAFWSNTVAKAFLHFLSTHCGSDDTLSLSLSITRRQKDRNELMERRFYYLSDIKDYNTPYLFKRGRRVIGISGSLIQSKTLMELIFNPCGEFRLSLEGPVSQIHSTRWCPWDLFRSFKVRSDAKERVGCGKQREAIAPIHPQ